MKHPVSNLHHKAPQFWNLVAFYIYPFCELKKIPSITNLSVNDKSAQISQNRLFSFCYYFCRSFDKCKVLMHIGSVCYFLRNVTFLKIDLKYTLNDIFR